MCKGELLNVNNLFLRYKLLYVYCMTKQQGQINKKLTVLSIEK